MQCPVDAEFERLHVLRSLGLLDNPPPPVLDLICQRTARTFASRAAAITLVEQETVATTACSGMPSLELPRDEAFCAFTVKGNEPFVVPDVLMDDRFNQLGMVLDGHPVRFYAGVPLTIEGARIGALCFLDTRPRQMESIDLILLRRLGDEVVHEICELQHTLNAPSPGM